jgi:hypothetical protein
VEADRIILSVADSSVVPKKVYWGFVKPKALIARCSLREPEEMRRSPSLWPAALAGRLALFYGSVA